MIFDLIRLHKSVFEYDFIWTTPAFKGRSFAIFCKKKRHRGYPKITLPLFSSNYLFGPIEGISNILTSSGEPCGCTVTPGVSVVVGTYPPSIYPPFWYNLSSGIL